MRVFVWLRGDTPNSKQNFGELAPMHRTARFAEIAELASEATILAYRWRKIKIIRRIGRRIGLL